MAATGRTTRELCTVTKSSFASAYAEAFLPPAPRRLNEGAVKAKGRVPPSRMKGFCYPRQRSTSNSHFPAPGSTSLWTRRPVHRVDAEPPAQPADAGGKPGDSHQRPCRPGFVTYPKPILEESWAREKVRQADESFSKDPGPLPAPSSTLATPITSE